ncbi:hypothetical protein [Desulfobacter postgatei]|uniref:Uncharacterized protein n=1 Tax=Desulfobacter postgatei 2ac9 TaxID=879212 RepID=I5B163_9BACT|nr:hypothetical protein [Desulfobacter postgatei]EIM63226.1 hypothetical protein DespoDRAFT_01266 [Desulfobacter postgatei 2ac9]
METGFFEVEVQNRLIRGTFAPKPTKGTQGKWHPEKLFFLAKDEIEAQQMAYKQIRARRMLGISKGRAKGKKIRREIKIIDVRRLV